MKKFLFAPAVLLLLCILLCPLALAESSDEEIELMSLTGGLTFSEIAIYDSDGATVESLVPNENMTAEVIIENKNKTTRNYAAAAAVYSEDGLLFDCAVKYGSINPFSQEDNYGVIQEHVSFRTPSSVEKAEVKIFLMESIKTLRPNGEFYFSADKNGIYKNFGSIKLKADLEVRKYTGVITSVPLTDYAECGYDADDTPEIRLRGYYTEIIDGVEYKMVDGSILSSNNPMNYEEKSADCSLCENASEFLGKTVTAYIGEEEDADTGHIMLYGIEEKRGANTVTAINASRLVDSYDREYTVPGQISYRNADSFKVYNLDIDSDVICYVNYERTSNVSYNSSTEDIDCIFDGAGGKIELISNDSDNKIEIVSILVYNDEAVIKKAENDDDVFTFITYSGDLDDIDLEAEDELVIVYKGGAIAEAGDIGAGDTVSIVEVGRDVRILYVSSETVTGVVTSYDRDEKTVTVNGNKYKLSAFSGIWDVASLANKEGTFYINSDGQIAYYKELTQTNYGLITAVAKDTGIEDTFYALVAMQDGTIAEYDFASKARFYDKDGRQKTSGDRETAEAVASIAAGTTSVSAAGTRTLAKNAYKAVFNIKFAKNGSISEVRTLSGDTLTSYLSANSKRYDAESLSYGSACFDDNTVVFGLKERYDSYSDNFVNPDNIRIGKVSRFFSDGDDEKTFASLDESDGIYGAVVGYEFAGTIPENTDAVIITSKSTVAYNGDDAVRITGVRGGEEVSYIIYDRNCDYTDDPDDISKGDVILVSNPDDENVVSDFKLLYTADSVGAGTVSPAALAGNPSKDVYNGAGWLDKDKIFSGKFFIDEDIENSAFTWAASEDGIVIGSGANYTLVDYTANAHNPVISQNPYSSVLSSNPRYDTYVFVRVCDDKLKEVVGYRYSTDSHNSYPYYYEGVVKNITTFDGKYSFYTKYGYIPDIDTGKAGVTVIKDNNPAGISDIEDGDTVFMTEYENEIIMAVSSQKITGSIESIDYSEDLYIINGQGYECSPYMDQYIDAYAGIECIFYLNAEGQIAYVEESKQNNYGFILAVAKSTGFDDTYYALIAMQDGTISEYAFASKAKFYDKSGTVEASDDRETASAVANVTAGTTSVSASGTKTLVKNAYKAVFNVEFDQSGKISKVRTLKGDCSTKYLTANSKRYFADSMTYGSVEFNRDAVIFGLRDAYNSNSNAVVNSYNLRIGKVSSLFSDGDDELIFAAIDEDDGIFGAVVAYDFSPTVPENTDAVIITSKSTVTYDGYDAVRITGIRGGEEVSYIIYDENWDYSYDPDDISKGDVILVSNPDSENVVSDFILLYTANSVGAGTVPREALAGNPENGIYNGAGVLDKEATRNSSSKFFINNDITSSGGAWAYAEDGIIIKQGINYTLVDYSESARNPEISVKTPSGAFSTSSRYDTYVFVRVYDDMLKEVVCYRYNAGTLSSSGEDGYY